MDVFLEWFWNPRVWLPPPVDWSYFTPGKGFRDFNDIYKYPIVFAAGFLLLRLILDKYFYSPLGIYLGIKIKNPKKAPYNEILETLYKNGRKDFKHICQAGDKLNWSGRQVERWLRMRKKQDGQSVLTKFNESAFRFTYYLFSFTYGAVILSNKDWLWKIELVWQNYPLQAMPSSIWWYYMFNLGFYLSLAISQFFETKRKDFWQMFIHHIATLSLLSFSWSINAHRIGSWVIFVHDIADVVLEATKMALYSQYSKLSDGLFLVFTITWIASRLFVYPFWVIDSLLRHSIPPGMDIYPAYWIFFTLFSSLLVLHIFWTYLILKMAYKSLTSGKVEGDIRSSSEVEELETINEETDKRKNGSQRNGTIKNGVKKEILDNGITNGKTS